MYKRLIYHDGWLLTHPDEDFSRMGMQDDENNTMYTDMAPSVTSVGGGPPSKGGNIQVRRL